MAMSSFHQVRDPAAKVRALSDYGSQVEVDKTIAPKLYFRSGREMLRMANMYCDEGNLESAFILYSKFITLFVEKLPTHPDYKTSSPPADVQDFKRKVKKVFPLAEEIKSKLKKKYIEEEEKRKAEEKKRQEQLAREEEKRRQEREKQIQEDEAMAKKMQSEAEEQWMHEQEEKYRQLQHQEEERLAAEKRRREEEEEAAKKNGGVPFLIPPDISGHVPVPALAGEGGSEAYPAAVSAGAHPPPSAPAIPDRELKKNLVINDQGPSAYPATPPPAYSPPIPDRSAKPLDHFMSTGLFGGGTGALREVIVPADLMKKFIAAAESNTARKTETMGILCGKVSSNAFKITHLFIPNQRGTPDSCDMENEEELIFYQDKHDLITLGWIHTHPTQTAFLSSVDLHSHYAYQKMLPEAIAIVVSPKFEETGLFSLTDHGLKVIGACHERSFHYHNKDPPLFECRRHLWAMLKAWPTDASDTERFFVINPSSLISLCGPAGGMALGFWNGKVPAPGDFSPKGLTTEEALSRLHDELSSVVAEYEKSPRYSGWRCYLNALSFSVGSLYPWPAALTVFVCATILFFGAGFSEGDGGGSGSPGWLVAEAIILLLTIIINVILTCWNSTKWQREAIFLSKSMLQTVANGCKNTTWTLDSYTDINTPISPCVSLQWTIRDSHLVNVPQPLLVHGDIIKLRPGHKAPGKCEELEPDANGASSTLDAGDVFVPEMDVEAPDSLPGPKARTPLVPQSFTLLETPVVENIRLMLEGGIVRPQSVLANECHTVVYVWIIQRLLPISVVLLLLINTLRYVYLPDSSGHWTEMFLILPVHGVLPLLPLTFPLMWLAVNTYGQARIFAAFQVAKTLKAWPLGSMSSIGSFSTISVEEARVDIAWRTVLSWFWAVFMGKAKSVCHNFDLLHVLGTVTSLCCVDKKGILSWANPSAEKIFFFSSAAKDTVKVDQSGDKQIVAAGDTPDVVTTDSKPPEPKRKKPKKFSKMEVPSRVEVLDLTHDARDAFKVFFDDPDWRQHMDSVKPLGLCILLNTCDSTTCSWYTQFSDHVGCAALQKEETVAVVNRRCMCEVAWQIGFTHQALEVFSHEKALGIYRQVPAEETEKERQQRAKSFLHHKIPMPNLTSVIVKDKASGMFQLLTQGTADIVLDNCVDYWNGTTLCTLTELDRKRILDFYHRNSMAAYCTAFSYKPIGHTLAAHLKDEYIELVDMPNHLMQRCFDVDALSGDGPNPMSRSFSMDSLMDDDSLVFVDDVAGYYEAQKNQTFIGMIALQYQARQDFIQLIDKLEMACIRFVHFSKENELRSRVFSEKMGLEAGWNCHISLLNDEVSVNEGPGSGQGSLVLGRRSAESTTSQDALDTHPNVERKGSDEFLASRSQSAPCVLAVDEVQVKFDVPEETDSGEGPTFDTGNGESESNKESKETHTVTHKHHGEKSSDAVFRLRPKSNHPRVRRSKRGEVAEEADDEGDEDQAVTKRLLTSSCSSISSSSSSASSSSSEEEELDHQSDSRYTSSHVTEFTDDSLTGALDNRAQLPRGIDQIRPHLAEVDNVPLLVNLFTDCTPPATQEMIKILQENGEVVLCIGSSLNMANMPMFLQADCSIAIEPPYPQLCARVNFLTSPWNEQNPSPTELTSRLISLPCSLAFQREDNISILQLIAEARHHTVSLRNCSYLMLCCQLCILFSFVFALAFLLPPPLTPPHLLWMMLIALPLLAVSLMGNPVDPKIMGTITNKNKQHVNKQMVIQFLLQFSLRFVPSIVVCLICFGVTLYSYCQNTAPVMCYMYVLRPPGHNFTYSSWDDKFSGGLIMAQNIFHLYSLFFFVVISLSLVHWFDHIWHQVPFTNKLWTITVVVLLVVQVVFCAADVVSRNQFTPHPMPMADVHPAVWVLGVVWPAVIVVLNELVKCLEIKFFLQRQRRARLDFGTKLGMNSPF